MNNRKLDIVPIVLHRLVADGAVERFDDFEVGSFSKLLQFCVEQSVSETSLGIAPFYNQKILITFDDGNITDFTVALPSLVAAKRSAVFFIVTDLIGRPNYMSWSQVRGLQQNGMIVGSHSVSHLNLCDLEQDFQKKELVNSRNIIEDKLGVAVDAFSFPFGRFNSELLELAKSAGYQYIFTSRHGLAHEDTNFFPRNSLNSLMSHSTIRRTLEAKLSTRLYWFLEDSVKGHARDLLGDSLYRKIRDRVK